MPDKIDRVPPRRPLQALLPIVDDRDDAAASSARPAAQVRDLVTDRTVEACLDPGDPDADLAAMSDEDIRREVHRLKAPADRRPDVIVRLLKAIGVLEHRGLLATPRGARCALADVPPARPWRSRASARRRFLGLLRRVDQAAPPARAEALAEFLAEDLVDSGSIGMWRAIARGIREGLVDPRTVRDAYNAAKKAGVERPGALFTWYVLERSPMLDRRRAIRQ